MASHRVGETGLSQSGLSRHHTSLAYGIGVTATATNFFDHEGAAYFGELEEALMQGVAGITSDHPDRKPFFTSSRPPTLEIFPSWPMRLHQTLKESSHREESTTDSGSGQNNVSQIESAESPVSRSKAVSSEQEMQEIILMGNSSDGPRLNNNNNIINNNNNNRKSTTTVVLADAPNYTNDCQEKKTAADSTGEKGGKILDAKTMRRLAQNREAARKSRLRKKAYIQQLETSKVKLAQLEQDLQRARSQGLFLGASAGANLSSGAAMFDMEYARWLDDNNRHINELRGGLGGHLSDSELRVIVDECLTHYDEIFRLKALAAKSDVFHLITGMWTTPVERCYLWMGGFRPSDLIKILIPQLDPLTEQQVVGICSLQQSSQQAEEALSQGLEQLHQSLADTVASGTLNEGSESDVSNYMGHMALALGKFSNLEGFVRQADNLRQQTLHQLHRILTVRQAARCFLAIGEYHCRLRALSSLWASRPRETMIADESNCNGVQMIHHQPVQNQFQAF